MSEKQHSIFDSMKDVFVSDHLSTKTVTVWTVNIDGASRGNPGAAGAGVFIKKNDLAYRKEGFFLGKKTNNEAEYYALLLALFLLKSEVAFDDCVIMRSDSQLLVRQMQGMYKVKKYELQQLYKIAKEESAHMNIVFEHVMREQNTTADALANEGVDKKRSLPIKFLDVLQRYEVFI